LSHAGGDVVVSRKASPKFSQEFEEIWSLDMGLRASNLAIMLKLTPGEERAIDLAFHIDVPGEYR
jgi:hypothetical protein